MQPDGHAIHAECADRLVEIDLSLLDVVALRLELVGNVRGGDGAEQLALVPDARREGERDLGQLVGEALRLVSTRRLGRLETLALLFDALAIARGRLEGVAAGQQEIARI